MTTHPNSLKNLKPAWTSESAREAQKNSVKARKANAEARAALKMTAHEFSKYKEEMKDVEVSAVNMLEVLMMKAFQEDDFDTAADLAKSLAEFQTPKLARTESTIKEVDADELTDEELEAKLRELGLKD